MPGYPDLCDIYGNQDKAGEAMEQYFKSQQAAKNANHNDIAKKLAELVKAKRIPKAILAGYLDGMMSMPMASKVIEEESKKDITNKLASLEAEYVKMKAVENSKILSNPCHEIDMEGNSLEPNWKPEKFPEYTLDPASKFIGKKYTLKAADPQPEPFLHKVHPDPDEVMTVEKFKENEREERLLEIAEQIACLEDEKRHLQNLEIAECETGEDRFDHLEI